MGEPCVDCSYKKDDPYDLPADLRVPEGEDITNKDKFYAENVDWSRVYGAKFKSAGPNNWSEIAGDYGTDPNVHIYPRFNTSTVSAEKCGTQPVLQQ